MSTPRKHHYVSRCLIENFFNSDGEVFLLDKGKGFIGRKLSSKGFFYDQDLNSIVTEEGTIDHGKIEDELNVFFEKDFRAHYQKLADVIESKDDFRLKNLAETGELEECILYIIRMGVIGDIRTPFRKAKSESSFEEIRKIILDFGSPELKSELKEYEQQTSQVKYRTALDYTEFADQILNGMGEKVITILLAGPSDFFLLPDTSSAHSRAQLVPDTISEDGTVYSNPAREIAQVALPINSKILIAIESSRISRADSHSLIHATSSEVLGINKWLFRCAYQKVACGDENYLKNFAQVVNEISK